MRTGRGVGLANYLVLSRQGKSAEAVERMRQLATTLGWAVDAVSAPVMRFLWLK